MTLTETMPTRPDELIVALGSTRYSVRRPWGDLPVGPGRVSDVAVDHRGHVFALLRRDSLADPPGPGIVELSPLGERLNAWGNDLIQDGHMLSVAPDGRLFIIDRDAHEVLICSPDGRRLGSLGERGRPNAPFNHPCGVAFGPDRRIFVCDGYANSRIHCFSADGILLHSWGERGNAPGQFVSPHAIAALPDGRLAVCDRYNHRVQLFTADGGLVGIWPGFYRPTAMTLDAEGNLHVLDQVPSLTVFSEAGEELGRCRPVLNGAHGIAIDRRSGVIYLAETSPNRITALVPRAAG